VSALLSRVVIIQKSGINMPMIVFIIIMRRMPVLSSLTAVVGIVCVLNNKMLT